MAVNVAAAPTAIHDYTGRFATYNNYSSHSSYSSGTATPSTASPESPRTTSTSPNNSNHMQQLRPLRAPTYIPAVLRPTEAPSRHRSSKSTSSASYSAWASPITPPSSVENSFDSKDGQRSMEETLQKRILSDEGITRIVTDEWNDEGLENVTGAPTRDHWKPDSSSPACDAPICSIPFTWRRRRHHCRRCGLVFCSEHSIREVPLDQHARFHPDGVMARACDTCWSDYTAWKRRRSERGSSSTGSSIGSGSATPVPGISRPGSLLGRSSRLGSSAGTKTTKEPVVGSVPRDWNWSTF